MTATYVAAELAHGDHAPPRHGKPQAATKRYFRFLATIGYEMSDVEQLVISKPRMQRPVDSPTAVAAAAETTPP